MIMTANIKALNSFSLSRDDFREYRFRVDTGR